MIYLDSSALLKLLVEEPESEALERWLQDHAGTPLVTSGLARVEVVRAVRRHDDGLVPAAHALADQLDTVPVSPSVLQRAADLPGGLRSLDAVHVASALVLGTPTVVAYDHRLLAAARDAGLLTQAPA